MEQHQGANDDTDERVKMAFNEYKSELSKEQMELLSAVETGSIEQVQDLANKSEILNRDESFDYLLIVAALQRRHTSIFKFLIEKIRVVKASGKTGTYDTPLYYAVSMNDFEIFTELWRKGASVSDKDANKMSALEFAMLQFKTAMIKVVLDGIIKDSEEPKTLLPDSKSHVALFHTACWTGNDEAIQMFMSHNFSLNSLSIFDAEKWKGFTPLHFLIGGRRANLSTVDSFLNHNDIDFNTQDELGRTCLHLAFENLSVYSSVIQSMLKHMCRFSGKQLINPENRDGLSHFHIFCSLMARRIDTIDHIVVFKNFSETGVDLDSSVSLDAKNYPGFTALHFAAETFSWDVLKLLLEHGADPTKTDKNGSTPLHVLCETKHHEDEHFLEAVQLLLKYGADPVAKDLQDCTPLHLSYQTVFYAHPLNNSEKFLLSRNQESINHTNKYGVSYLHIACAGDDLDVVKALVNNGAPVNSYVKLDSPLYNDYSPLHFAVESQQVEIVEFLLSRGADLKKSIGESKTTSLHLACRCDLLLPPDKDKHEKDDVVDWLPSRAKQIRIVELLIEHGADVDAKTFFGCTPLLNILDEPCILGQGSFPSEGNLYDSLLGELFVRQQKVMDILLHHGANINAQESCEGSILHMLAKNFQEFPLNKELAEIALKRGANVNCVDKPMGYTPLHVAVDDSMEKELDTSFINLLFEYGADVNAKSTGLETPLHVALEYHAFSLKHKSIFKKLLDRPKIDINASNSRKQTPLHMALNERNDFATEKLLEAGADINLEDSDGNPPTHHLVEFFENEFEDADEEGDLNTLICVIVHVKKMKKLNYFINEKVIDNFETLSKFLTEECLTALDDGINKEVEELKAHRRDSYTSLYDILFKDSTAMVKHMKNKEVLAALLLIHCHWGYTLFGDILTRQYQKGYDRYEILEPAKAALGLVTNVSWPDSCSEEILSNLSDDNLKSLIQCVPGDKTCKRSSDFPPKKEGPPEKISRCDQ